MKVRLLVCRETRTDVDQDQGVEDQMILTMVVKMVKVDLEIMLVSLHINKGILLKNNWNRK